METWICPLDPAHRYTGDNTAWVQYLNHFLAQHTPSVADLVLIPSPAYPHMASLDLSDIFGQPTHIDYMVAKVKWYSTKAGEKYHFYNLYLKGYGDKRTNPSKLRVFHGVIGSSGEFYVGKVPADPIGGRPSYRMDIDRSLSDLLFSAFETTKAYDLITEVEVSIKGWV